MALIVALLAVTGIGAYAGFLYFNPDQAPVFISDLIAPPQPKVIPLPPPPPPVAAEPVVDEEAVAWEELKDLNRPTADSLGDLANFVDTYPSGKDTAAAREKLAALNQEAVNLVKASLAFTATADQQGDATLTIKPWGNIFVDDAPKAQAPPLKNYALRKENTILKSSIPVSLTMWSILMSPRTKLLILSTIHRSLKDR